MTGEEVRQTLAKNIKKLRAQKGFSQAQLAEEADISLPFMSSIEQSSKWPYPDTLAQIAAALGVDVSDLFSTGENEAKNHQQTVEIVKALVENGSDVYSMAMQSNSLEDVFHALTEAK